MMKATTTTLAALATAGAVTYLAMTQFAPPPPPPLASDEPPVWYVYRIAPTNDGVMREYYWPIVTNWVVTNQWFTNRFSQTNHNGGHTGLDRIVEINWTGETGRLYVVESSVTGGGTPHPAGSTNQGWIGDNWTPCSLFITGYNGAMSFTSAIPYGPRVFRLTSL